MRNIFIFLFAIKIYCRELVLLNAIWRHGQRTPISIVNGIYDAFPDNNLASLLPEGMKEMAEQGLRMRQKYIYELKFLSSEYKENEIYIRSTFTRRTQNSAECFLAGLYGSHTNGLSINNHTYISIPIFSDFFGTAYSYGDMSTCIKGVEMFTKIEKSKNATLIIDKSSNLIEYVNKSVNSSLKNVWDFLAVYDTLKIYREYNFSLPTWVNQTIFDELTKFNSKFLGLISGDENNDDDRISTNRKLGGLILKNIFDKINLTITNLNSNVSKEQLKREQKRNNLSAVKFLGYSVHDFQVNSLLNIFGIKKALIGDLLPNYSSVFVIELWKNENSYEISLLYSANSTDKLTRVTKYTNNCMNKEYCLLSAVKNEIKRYIPDDILSECGLPNVTFKSF
uniref:Histidine acid phosphatase n=1 Tax=Rhabditophanes sp. KR3021 TaxID=114890 RepID=A0AC35TFV2_9BILA